jgi:hypothetical protein
MLSFADVCCDIGYARRSSRGYVAYGKIRHTVIKTMPGFGVEHFALHLAIDYPVPCNADSASRQVSKGCQAKVYSQRPWRRPLLTYYMGDGSVRLVDDNAAQLRNLYKQPFMTLTYDFPPLRLFGDISGLWRNADLDTLEYITS